MPYYFKREQFYKDSTPPKEAKVPDQRLKQQKEEEELFFSKEQFYKEKTPSPKEEKERSEVSEPLPESTPRFQAHRFTIGFPPDWQDKTIYTLVGPEEDGAQHNIIITVDEDVQADSVSEYADQQIGALEE
jgi:hypothetical protein